jgi:hypothetical protein
MRVGQVIPYQAYWERYPSKRPSSRTPVARRGDNIWHCDTSGTWHGVRGAIHNDIHRDHDLRGKNVLIASEFYYFGRKSISVPDWFRATLPTTQGHKNTYDTALITRFWDWLSGSAPAVGRIGLPSEFTETGCSVQRADVGW